MSHNNKWLSQKETAINFFFIENACLPIISEINPLLPWFGSDGYVGCKHSHVKHRRVALNICINNVIWLMDNGYEGLIGDFWLIIYAI